MMTINELVAGGLMTSTHMLGSTLADITEAEMLNHAAWQLGHLAVAAHGMLSGCGATLSPLPAGFKEKYTKETSKIDDASKFDKKADLLAILTKINTEAAAYTKTLSADDFGKPGPEQMRSMCPTVADVLNLQAVHIAMHLGQFQVLRRKLGKPVMF
jgi:hypothetical protein